MFYTHLVRGEGGGSMSFYINSIANATKMSFQLDLDLDGLPTTRGDRLKKILVNDEFSGNNKGGEIHYRLLIKTQI